MTKHDLVIIGCGGFGREVLETIHQTKDYHCIGFLDDNKKKGSKCNNVQVLGNIDWLKKRDKHLVPLGVVVTVADPYKRQEIVSKIQHIENIWFPSIIHPSVTIPKSTSIGDGVIIQNNSFISCNVSINDFTHINCLSVIGHDDIIGKYVTLSPGSKVMGNVVLGDRVFFGVNASTTRGIKIGDDAVLGGGSFVLESIPKESCFYGSPAKFKRKNLVK
jgi:sugar O-acyltransferase (sialic acid O-acetyltransferase NeuD family)